MKIYIDLFFLLWYSYNKKEGVKMSIKYYKLLDLMNRNGIGKEELRKKIEVSPATEYVSLEVIDKICSAMNCQPGDILEHIKE